MADPLPDTWHSRDLPVLREVVRLCDERPMAFIEIAEVMSATGLSEIEVTRAGVALQSAGLVKTLSDMTQVVSDFREPSARARQLAGAWPTPESALNRMIAALETIASNTDDEDDRTKAQRLAAWLRGSASTVGLSVATAAITGQLPGAGA